MKSAARLAAARDLGIGDEWAWMRQVHGGDVRRVAAPGPAGEADALVTRRPGLPLAIRTADCVPVVIHGDTAVAVVHAGWRGLASGVVENAIAALGEEDAVPRRAAVGPSIGPCCYEVGPEVVAALGGRTATTSWGTTSVDLWSETERRLSELDVWRADLCTRCEKPFHSFRADGTVLRQTTLGWL
jgi:YfiH family protein